MWRFNKPSRLPKGFLGVDEIFVPRTVADEAQQHLREAGVAGYEAFALWVGTREDRTFSVRETLIPEQTGHRTPSGVWVDVEAEELHRINVWLFEHGMTLVAQLHSHPGAAYHSDLDDTLPIATTLGALSLVVPNYAADPFAVRTCAVYRLLPRTGWTEIGTLAAEKLIKIVD